MDQWLETKQLPVHFVSAAGVVYMRVAEDIWTFKRKRQMYGQKGFKASKPCQYDKSLGDLTMKMGVKEKERIRHEGLQ